MRALALLLVLALGGPSAAAGLEELIRSLQALKAEMAVYSDIEVTIKIEN